MTDRIPDHELPDSLRRMRQANEDDSTKQKPLSRRAW